MNNKFHKVIRFHKGWKRSILIILILLISSVGINPASGAGVDFQVKTALSPAAPVITGQDSLSTLEDTPLSIVLKNLIVTDPDKNYPTGFTLTVLPGTNYTFVDTTITPVLNFVGALTVPVKVNNGTVESNIFDLTVSVTPANGVPVADSRIPPGERPNGNTVRPKATSTIANPTLVAPANGATGVSSSPTLTVHVSNTGGTNMTVSFYGRATNSVGAPFTLVALPDTQCYSGGEYNYDWCGAGGIPEMFYSQTQWIAENRAAQNIVFVTHLGDVTNDGDSDSSEWDVADTAMSYLEDPATTGLPGGVPYGITPGNHDQTIDSGTTVLYNSYFGSSRFNGRGYYGGHYGSNNNNNYELFSAGGMDFIIVHLEYNPTNGAITWADNLLKTYSNRRAIVSSHAILYPGNPADFDSAGTNIYNGLKNNPNLFLMLCGHEVITGQRTDSYLGNTIYSLMSDYQWGDNGGDGWLRLMKFVPSLNQIQVSTYSPYEDEYSTTSDDQFNLSYKMGFSLIGTANNVPSGTNSSITWNGLTNNTQYDWYAVASDGVTSATSATWNFTTGASQTLTVGKSGTGTGTVTSNPSGINCGSTCSYSFTPNTVVTLTAAATSPSTFGGWSGAGCSGTGTCQITMSAAQSVIATFTITPTLTGTSTHTVTPSSTFTPTNTATLTSSITPTYTRMATDTLTPTPTTTITPTLTATNTLTPTPSTTSTSTLTVTDTLTPTPTTTMTATPTDTNTLTPTPTATATLTPTISVTFTQSRTPTKTLSSTATLANSVLVTVLDTDGLPVSGLKVYAYSGGVVVGSNKITNTSGQVVFSGFTGSYRFEAQRNSTNFWSDTSDSCTVPGCTSASVTVTKPLTVTVLDTDGVPQAGLKVYAFSGGAVVGGSKVTDGNGRAVFSPPIGSYRFDAQSNGGNYWSATSDNCTVPGCTSTSVTVPKLVTNTPMLTATNTLTPTPSTTSTSTLTVTDTLTPTPTTTISPTPAVTDTLTPTPTAAATLTPTISVTFTQSRTPTKTLTPTATLANSVTVTVLDTDGLPVSGLKVYAYSSGVVVGSNKITNTSGQVVFSGLTGSYRFEAQRNSTNFWSDTSDSCTVPGCTSASVTVTKPLTVTVLDTDGVAQSGLKVYAFSGGAVVGGSKVTDVNGRAVFSPPVGSYRFDAQSNGGNYWSATSDNCTVPGCTSASVTVPKLVTNTPTLTATNTTTQTPSKTMTATPTATDTITPTPSTTMTSTPTATDTLTPTPTTTVTFTPSRTPTNTPTLTATLVNAVTVTVLDTDGLPVSGLKVYPYSGGVVVGSNKITNTSGQAVFSGLTGSFRFQAQRNSTNFWSDTSDSCTVPGCTSASVTVTKPLTVTVLDTDGVPQAGLKVYAFSGGAAVGGSKITDVNGQAVFSPPIGSYRFDAQSNGGNFWSDTSDSCTVPGCTSASVTVTKPLTVTVFDTGGIAQPGLSVSAYSGITAVGSAKTTDVNGQAVFALPAGGYTFRVTKSGLYFWSGMCIIPGSTSTIVTVSP